MTIPCTLFYVQISLKINFSKKYQYSCNKSQSKRQIELMTFKKHVNQRHFFCIESSKWNSFISANQSDFERARCAIQIKQKFHNQINDRETTNSYCPRRAKSLRPIKLHIFGKASGSI